MKTINHECYVSPEVAKLLEQVGFDWKCKYAYIVTPEGDMSTGEEGMLTDYVENVNWIVKAPTLDVVQRWLREIKNIEIYISWEIEFEEKELDWNKRRYCYDIDTHVNSIPLLSIDDDYWAEGYHTFGNSYSTYEEAQEAGIKKALEIILEKVE